MKIIDLDPNDRIVSLEIADTDDIECKYLIVNLPKYYCPSCKDITAFSISDKHKTILPVDIKKAFDKRTSVQNEFEYGFVDVQCRLCKKSARVIYKQFEFHMGAYKYYALKVLEVKE